MPNVNEPTTGVLAQELRRANEIYMLESNLLTTCADRLESQEREITRLRSLSIVEKESEAIAALTARAEQAEKERDAAFAVIGIQAEKLKESHVVLCNICEFEDMIGCVHKSHCDGYQLFKWRGLPQEGEGK